MIRLIIELVVLYLLYKFVFELIIPIYRATKQMRDKMEDTSRNRIQSTAPEKNESPKPAPKDYIDYEEIKD